MYTGFGLGSTQFSGRARDENQSMVSSAEAGAQLRLGYAVTNTVAVEAGASFMGSATLDSTSPGAASRADVDYSAASLSMLLYGLKGVEHNSGHKGFSVYGRLGFAELMSSSDSMALDDSETVPLVGVGAEYGFANGFGLRYDVIRYDNEATSLGFGMIYRFGTATRHIRSIATAPEPDYSDDEVYVLNRLRHGETVVERYPGPGVAQNIQSVSNLQQSSDANTGIRDVGTMNERWRPAMRPDDKDLDGVLDPVDKCPDTRRHVTVDRDGCGLFDANLKGVNFDKDSLWLEPHARRQLDQLAEKLLAFPEAVVQVRAHVYSMNSAELNLQTSTNRARAVVFYLQSRGVHSRQLNAQGAGSAKPLRASWIGRQKSKVDRIEVVTLAEYDEYDVEVPKVPELLAAMPVSRARPQPQSQPQIKSIVAVLDAIAVGKIVPEVPATMLALALTNRSKVAGVEVSPPRLLPLPQPGVAPEFNHSGVIEDVRFTPGSSALSKNSETALQPLLNDLRKQSKVKVAIMAHTDNIGSAELNKQLSLKRADAVVSFLVSSGIHKDRLKAEGYGELLPLVQNVTAADRQRNRRVEVRVLPDF